MRIFAGFILLVLVACSRASEPRTPPLIENSWTDYDAAYEVMAMRGRMKGMAMEFYNEKTGSITAGVRGDDNLPPTPGPIGGFETCTYGDVLCIEGYGEVPMVISTDFAKAQRELARAGFDLTEISSWSAPCSAYRIMKRNAGADPPRLEYVVCPFVGVTTFSASSLADKASRYELRSTSGLGARNMDKFDWRAPRGGRARPATPLAEVPADRR